MKKLEGEKNEICWLTPSVRVAVVVVGGRGRLPPINHTASEAGREVAEGKWKEDAWWGNERCP